MTKHFPGGGPQLDGEDPHFDYGREQVYPGGNLEYHVRPFAAVIAAGGAQVMPYYGMPVGTELEPVGFGFNRGVITGMLRERLRFDGIVCTDWGLINDGVIMGQPMPARAWGLASETSTRWRLTPRWSATRAIVPEIAAGAAALLASYGTSARAFADVIFGAASPRGRLPFDLPSSTRAVEESRTDVPFDTANPLFRFGEGITYHS